jgi:arginine decarboxylase
VSRQTQEKAPRPAAEESWTGAQASDLYRVDAWGDGFFHVNERGHAAVRPLEDSNISIDIVDVVADILARGVQPPVLIRFQDVLQARVRRLARAFQGAIEESGYGSVYRGVYPIKVNQLHEVVEEVLAAGRPFGLGLECGSKTELVAALPHLIDDESLLVCNGVKDASMLRLILDAQSLGRNVVPVVEKFTEFERLMRLGRELDVQPRFGARIRLATSGSGRWEESGGDQSKFGISVPELVTLMERLGDKRAGFVLLHFHLGSQIADIHVLKQAVKEITQVYAQLIERDVPVRYLDVGGGLGVNYDAGYGDASEGINYSLQEYANAVVYAVKEVCDEEKVPHPILVSESGRAISAHHSVLIVEVLGAYGKDRIDEGFAPAADDTAAVRDLDEIRRRIGSARKRMRVAELLEAYHDAVEIRREADTMFGLGYLPLEQKALVERLFWSACAAIHARLSEAPLDSVPAALHELEERLSEQYLCDFSVFQSMLDHWAIDQAFPIMPIDRLDERPTRRGVLVDLTCDSDGKVDHYVSSNPDRRFIELHALEEGKPYYLGFFLMGAYQDIMGDSHNLFGRVPEVHVYADAEEPGGYYVEKLIPGTAVQDMLALVQYFPNDLHRRMNEQIRQKIEGGKVRAKVGMEMLERYMRCFQATTYCDPREAGGGGS